MASGVSGIFAFLTLFTIVGGARANGSSAISSPGPRGDESASPGCPVCPDSLLSSLVLKLLAPSILRVFTSKFRFLLCIDSPSLTSPAISPPDVDGLGTGSAGGTGETARSPFRDAPPGTDRAGVFGVITALEGVVGVIRAVIAVPVGEDTSDSVLGGGTQSLGVAGNPGDGDLRT